MPLQALEYGLEVVYRLIGHYKALPRVVLEELAHDIKIVLAGGRALGVVAKWREYAVLPLEPVKYELPELIDLQRVALCKDFTVVVSISGADSFSTKYTSGTFSRWASLCSPATLS